MTPEEIIEFYNFKTEKNLNRLRENIKRFEHEDIYSFASLILDCENYDDTYDQSKATNTLILNSRKEFTFTNSVDGDKETILKEGKSKICREYTGHSHFRGTRYFKQDDFYYLIFVKPVKYANYTPQKIGFKK